MDVNEDTTITTFRGGVAHAHTVCPYTVRTVGRVDARRGRIQHFVSATVCTPAVYVWEDLKWPFCVGNYTPVLYFIYVFSLGFIRVKFCVVHVFCCDRPNEWFLHPLNFGLAPRGVCSTYGPRTFSIVSYIFEERWEIRRELHPKVWPGPGQHEEPCNYDTIARFHACGAN